MAIHQGILGRDVYDQALRASRFNVNTIRYSNVMSSKMVDVLAQGTIAIIPEESGSPSIFSQPYACLQTYRADRSLSDIEAILRRHDDIIRAFLPHAADLHRELAAMYPCGQARASRFLRHLLFIGHVARDGRAAATKHETAAPTCFAYNDPAPFAGSPGQLQRLAERTLPTREPARPAHWLRLALVEQLVPTRDGCAAVLEQGLAQHPRSLPLHYARALCRRLEGDETGADAGFARIAAATLDIAPDDPFPRQLDRLHGSFWVIDARVRARCPDVLAPLVAEAAVWRSFALSHRADIAFAAGLGSDGAEAFAQAAALAEQALDEFPYNDIARRLYLRAAYALHSRGLPAWDAAFLEAFELAERADRLMFHDFAALAIELSVQRGRPAAAQAIAERLTQFLQRALLPPDQFVLYPEAEPLLVRHNLPHGHLQSPDDMSLLRPSDATDRVVAERRTEAERVLAELRTEAERALAELRTETERVTAELKSELARIADERDTAMRRLAFIYKTTSWRVTAPLRDADRVIRTLKRRLATRP